MAKTSLGIDVGNSRIKLVEMKGETLLKCVIEDVPENMVRNGEIIAFEAMAQFIKELVKKHRFGSKKVSFVVPDDAVYIRRLTLPAMSASQLEVNLPYEFRDFIPGDKADFLFDYRMVELKQDEDGKITDMDLLAVAVSTELMDKYAHMFKMAGLKLVEALPECLALGNLLRTIRPEEQNNDYAVLDLGYVSTRINMYNKGIFDLNREIETGVKHICDEVADILAIDTHIASHYLVQNREHILENERIIDECNDIAISAMRAVNYYTYQKRDNTLEYMYVCGGGSALAPLVQSMANAIPLKLVYLKDFSDDHEMQEALQNAPAALGVLWNS